MSDKKKKIFVIIDRETGEFWKSGTKKTSWPSAATAKSAFSSSGKNKLGTYFGNQERFQLACVDLNGELKAYYHYG